MTSRRDDDDLEQELDDHVAFSPTLRAFLYGVPAVDVESLFSVAGVLTGVALISCYVPSRHATTIDPLKALRQE